MNEELRHAIVTWIVLGIAIFAVGPVVGLAAGLVTPGQGEVAATPLTAASPILGVLAAAIAIAIAIGWGVATARIASARLGLAATGLALAWANWSFGRLDDVLRAWDGAAPLIRLAVEGALVMAAVVGGTVLIDRHRRDVDARPRGEGAPLLSQPSLMAAAATAVIAALVGWIFARSPLIGQGIAAAAAAGLAGTAVARTLAYPAPLAAFTAGGIPLALLAPLWTAAAHGGAPIEAYQAGTLPPLALVMPFDWACGFLLGVPLGDLWAHSMLDHQSGQAGASSTASDGA